MEIPVPSFLLPRWIRDDLRTRSRLTGVARGRYRLVIGFGFFAVEIDMMLETQDREPR